MTQELITMTPRELARYEIIKRLLKKVINGTQASEQMGLSIRQVKNLKVRVGKEGAQGIIHKSRGRVSNRRLPEPFRQQVEAAVRKRYSDFGPTFASEKLQECEQLKINHETLRQLMTDWGLWQPHTRKQGKEYRAWRARKEHYGEMEQFDGSYFQWFEQRAPERCLLAAIDDATGKPTQLRFVDWEGVKNAFSFWKDYLETKGKPISIYLDRHSTYKQNQKSVFDDPNCLTQFERAMKNELDIKIIHAYSPQAKGRVEKLFETLQDRLVKELRLADISTIDKANQFANEVFLPRFQRQFSVKPAKQGNLHRALTKWEKDNLEQIFSIHSQRIVNNDFTVKFKGNWYQLAKQQPVLVRPKERIRVEERIDGMIFLSLKNKNLNFAVLPERPVKVKMQVIALSGATPTWKPPADHPWRRPFLFDKSQRCPVSTLSANASPEAN